jgi:hypothetical protein
VIGAAFASHTERNAEKMDRKELLDMGIWHLDPSLMLSIPRVSPIRALSPM